MATQKARKDESKGMKRYWASPKRKQGSRRKSERAVHLVPDAMAAAALALPFVSGTSGTESVMTDLQHVMQGNLADLGNIPYHIAAAMKAEAPLMIELGVGALLVKWGAKKLGFNRVGTKKVKLA